MDTYENEYTSPKSPYADSPYECAFAPEEQPVQMPKASKPRKRRWIAVLVLVACCLGTALGVSHIWQSRMDAMETAMNEKFAALQQLYAESQKGSVIIPLPETGPMTPGQVYAKNVDAVVAVISRYESNGGYVEGTGSGFVISADGYVVTNYHVIEKASAVEVVTHGGETLQAKVIGSESTNDVALLKVEGENMSCVTLGSSDALAVGDQVAAIGNPLGELISTMTVGYISAKDRIVDTDGTVINMLQTDAAINSGNSGGPLFNMNGEVVGIITAKYSGNSNSGASIEGIGFAIPMDDVEGIISDLRQYGYVTGAYLGVYVKDVDSSAQSYGLPAGAYVEETVSGYAAQKAGIRAGDIIVNIGGYDVDSVTTLTRVLRRFKAGQTVSVTVYRGGRQEYLSATLDEKPVTTEPEPTPNTPAVPNENDNRDWWFDFFAPFFGG